MMEDTNYPSPKASAGKAFHQSSSTQSRLQRRINDTSRLQREAIKDLQRLQAARPPRNPLNLNLLPPGLGSLLKLKSQSPRQSRPYPRPRGPRHPAPGIRPPESGPRPPAS
jgi:hypothetical protein